MFDYAKQKVMDIFQSVQDIPDDHIEGAGDYIGGGALISGALYANLSNGMHLLALGAGTFLICRRAWKQIRRDSKEKKKNGGK